MSTFDCLYSFNLCLMGLGCPLLRGSSDRRLRRCAATITKDTSPLTLNPFTCSKYYFCVLPL